jgi:hypothetical protein
MRLTRGTQPTSAWRTTNVVARSAITMVDHILLSKLAQASQQLSLGLAEGCRAALKFADFELEGHFTAVKSQTTKTSLRINRGYTVSHQKE